MTVASYDAEYFSNIFEPRARDATLNKDKVFERKRGSGERLGCAPRDCLISSARLLPCGVGPNLEICVDVFVFFAIVPRYASVSSSAEYSFASSARRASAIVNVERVHS